MRGGGEVEVEKGEGKIGVGVVKGDIKDMMMMGGVIGDIDPGLEIGIGIHGEGDRVHGAMSGGETMIGIRGRGGRGVIRRHEGEGRIRGIEVIGAMSAAADIAIVLKIPH